MQGNTTPSPKIFAEIEEAILGGLMFDTGMVATPEVGNLPTAAFQISAHRHIFNAILAGYQSGKLPDANMVAIELTNKNRLEEVGGKAKLAQLLDRTVHTASLPYYIHTLKENYHRRYLANSLEQVVELAQDMSLEDAIALAKEEIDRLEYLGGSNGATCQLRAKIAEILDKAKSPTDLKAELMRLAKQTGHQPQQLEQMASALEDETDYQADKGAAKSALPKLLDIPKDQITPHEYLWGDGGRLADAMNRTAVVMPSSISPIFSTFMAASASRIGTSSRLVVKAAGKYSQLCIFWVAIVGRSGQLKTPAQKLVIDPLVSLECDAKKEYDAALEEYEEESENWEKGQPKPQKPVRRRFLTKDSTLESLERIHNENPRGLLVYRDELIGEIKAQNAYRNGRGSDNEALLDQWNGSAIIVDRKEREILLSKSAISRTGSIQWDVLQKMMGDHDDQNGSMARWLFCASESPPRYFKWDAKSPDTGIHEMLKQLYKDLDSLPEKDYFLSDKAGRLFEIWQNHLVDWELSEKHHGMAVIFPKIEAYTIRIALWLHLVNSVLGGNLDPEHLVAEGTMSKAIQLAQFFLAQAQLIHNTNSPQSGLIGKLLKLMQFVKHKVDGVSLRDIQKNLRAYRNSKSRVSEIERDCLLLAEQNYLRYENKMVFPLSDDCRHHAATMPPVVAAPETYRYQEVQDFAASAASAATIVDVESPPGESPPLEEIELDVPPMPTSGALVELAALAALAADASETVDIQGVEHAATTGGNVAADAATEHLTPAPQPPSIKEVVDRLRDRTTWADVLADLDAIALLLNKSRSAVFNKLKGFITTEVRHHLIKLLAKEMGSQENAHYWNWLSGCARKMLWEAAALARAT